MLTNNQNAFSQWVNNPAENTKVVSGTFDPVNISAVTDFRKGVFIFWEDKRIDSIVALSGKSSIYFIHVDETGTCSFNDEGKTISTLNGAKVNPVASENLPNSAVVVWKNFSRNSGGNLYAQRVDGTGQLLWTDEGLQITSEENPVLEYSLASDYDGNSYLIYQKRDKKSKEFVLETVKISVDGKLIYQSKNAIEIHRSYNGKSNLKIIPDNNGGAFIFWLENSSGKGSLFAGFVDSSGGLLWNPNPKKISTDDQNVLAYSVSKNSYAVYIAWQISLFNNITKQNNKNIYHQLIDFSGRFLWEEASHSTDSTFTNKFNPQTICSDSLYTLSWTSETNNDRNIYIQKFKPTGKPLWNKPVPVVEIKGNQFGQKIINDEKGGNILAWIDRRVPLTRANIYAQKVDYSGQIQWDSTSLEVAVYEGSVKSYLSLIPDYNDGAIVIFKDKRAGNNGIYAQKIFNTGTYASDIIGFNTGLVSDSVKISWYSANESDSIVYEIERLDESDTLENNWELIASFLSDGSKAKYYEHMDKPVKSGTVYYRLVLKDSSGKHRETETSSVNYFLYKDDIAVAQNNPNPFYDSTVISFFLPFDEEVKIEFFNSQVEKISEMQKVFPAGENRITFYAEDKAAGIYFYRISVNDFVDVKKMVIVNK